jgi:hypothetical protein
MATVTLSWSGLRPALGMLTFALCGMGRSRSALNVTVARRGEEGTARYPNRNHGQDPSNCLYGEPATAGAVSVRLFDYVHLARSITVRRASVRSICPSTERRNPLPASVIICIPTANDGVILVRSDITDSQKRTLHCSDNARCVQPDISQCSASGYPRYESVQVPECRHVCSPGKTGLGPTVLR